MMIPKQADFQEIAHCGGQVTIRVVTDKNGRRAHQLQWQHQRPVAASLLGMYALPQGIAVGQMSLGGIGQPPNPPPLPGCFPVLMGSDSEGLFGHQCPACNGYWRGRPGVLRCPYCGVGARIQDFLTTAQRSYIAQFCAKMRDALSAENDGDYVIDMDAVADAVGKDAEKPPFYYAEESQQNRFTCAACGGFTDLLGTFGYCSVCGTRNDLQELSQKVIPALRDRINGGGPYESCVKDAVAAFDSLVGRYVEQLINLVPMTPARRARFENRRFHNLESVAIALTEVFDISILEGLRTDDVEFAKLMFHRRHVYEHKGGEADEKYIQDSGDNTVRPKQALRETQEAAHRIASLVLRMADNLHRGFHAMIPTEQGPIARHQEYRRQLKAEGREVEIKHEPKTVDE